MYVLLIIYTHAYMLLFSYLFQNHASFLLNPRVYSLMSKQRRHVVFPFPIKSDFLKFLQFVFRNIYTHEDYKTTHGNTFSCHSSSFLTFFFFLLCVLCTLRDEIRATRVGVLHASKRFPANLTCMFFKSDIAMAILRNI